MSAQDKIYGTADQYRAFKAWAKEVGFEYSPYCDPDICGCFCGGGDEYVIVNTTYQEQYLLTHCPLTFVRDWIRDKYQLERNENLVPHWRVDEENVRLIWCKFHEYYSRESVDTYYYSYIDSIGKIIFPDDILHFEDINSKNGWFTNHYGARKALEEAAKRKIEELEKRIQELEDLIEFG